MNSMSPIDVHKGWRLELYIEDNELPRSYSLFCRQRLHEFALIVCQTSKIMSDQQFEGNDNTSPL